MKRIILALALIGLMTPGAALFAQQKGASSPEAEALIAKAKAEGKVTFYANITAIEPVMEAFTHKFGVKEILVAGGVSANQVLRQTFENQKEFRVHIPALSLCTDNAAMIAAAGYFRYTLGHKSQLDIDIQPSWPLS